MVYVQYKPAVHFKKTTGIYIPVVFYISAACAHKIFFYLGYLDYSSFQEW